LLDVRLPKVFEADLFDRFQQPNQSCPQPGGQGLDLRIDTVIERFDGSLHLGYIACSLYSFNILM
jgi:hypothetical protein